MQGSVSVAPQRPRIAVLVKHVPIADGEPVLAPGGLATGDRPRGLDPINEVGLEWALRQRSAGRASTVITLTMGPPDAADSLRRTLAFGADEALLVTDPKLAGSDVRRTARVLAAAVDHVRATIAVFGYESLDGSSGVVPAGLAAVLGWPVLSRTSDARWNDDDSIDVDRDAGHGPQRVRVGIPVALSFVEGRVEPRYPALRKVLHARSATIPEIDHDRLCTDRTDSASNERVLRTEPIEPSPRETQLTTEDEGPDAIHDLLVRTGVVS